MEHLRARSPTHLPYPDKRRFTHHLRAGEIALASGSYFVPVLTSGPTLLAYAHNAHGRVGSRA